MMKPILLFLLAVAFIANTKQNSMQTLDSQLQSMIDQGKTPSVSYLMFSKDSVIHSFYSGHSSLMSEELVNEKTTYSGFSVTKTFTALAILQLVEKKSLKLSDKVKSHLPDFAYDSSITIQHLLNHCSGIPNPLPLKWVHSVEEHDTFNRNQFFDQIIEQHHKTKEKPDVKFRYSNIGYHLLGEVIEKVSNMRYEDYVQKYIISPLEIKQEEMSFDISNHRHHATAYQKRATFMNFLIGFLFDKKKYIHQKEGQWDAYHPIMINGTAHGGIICTPSALMIYLQSFLKKDSKLISEENKALLFAENISSSGQKTGMCLSWFKSQLAGKTYHGHPGGGVGYYCEMRLYPDEGVGSIIMLNRTGVKNENILDQFDQLYFESNKPS